VNSAGKTLYYPGVPSAPHPGTGNRFEQPDDNNGDNEGDNEKSEAIDGVHLEGSIVSLEGSFMEYVRLAFVAVTQYHGDG